MRWHWFRCWNVACLCFENKLCLLFGWVLCLKLNLRVPFHLFLESKLAAISAITKVTGAIIKLLRVKSFSNSFTFAALFMSPTCKRLAGFQKRLLSKWILHFQSSWIWLLFFELCLPFSYLLILFATFPSLFIRFHTFLFFSNLFYTWLNLIQTANQKSNLKQMHQKD